MVALTAASPNARSVRAAVYCGLKHHGYHNSDVSRAYMSPFIYVLGTKPWQNVLGTCSRYTSVHITSTVKCSRYRFVQICNRHNSRAAQYDVLCIHCATCEVILMCTLRADSGLRAKPRPLSTLFSVP